MERVHVHVLITGKVQGVGYRYATQEAAIARGLAGWVRNLPNGRVEAVFEGDRAKVDEIIHWCRQGPPAASVSDVMVTYEPLEGFQRFEVRRS